MRLEATEPFPHMIGSLAIIVGMYIYARMFSGTSASAMASVIDAIVACAAALSWIPNNYLLKREQKLWEEEQKAAMALEKAMEDLREWSPCCSAYVSMLDEGKGNKRKACSHCQEPIK